MIEVLSPAAKTATKTTSARPTISAADVVAVRRRVAHRVLARQPAGLVEGERQRPADRAGDRPHDVAGDERDADEQQHRAAGQSAEAGGGGPGAEHALQQGEQPEQADGGGDVRRAAAAARRRGGQGVGVQRRHGRHPRRAHGRHHRGHQRDADAHARARSTIVRPASTSPLEGRSSAASKSAPSSAAMPSPASRPSTDAATPMASASTATARRTCRARRAERAQQRELARPLGDRDRERVEDDEGAHQQRRAREREQRRREEAADRVVGGVGLFGRVRGAGLDGHRARQRAAHRGGEALGRDARVGGDDDARQVAGALEPALDVGEPRHDQRGAADRRPVAPLPDAGDHDALDARARASGRRAGRRAGPGPRPAGDRPRPRRAGGAARP